MKKRKQVPPMSDRTYAIVLCSVLAACMVISGALFIYTAKQYEYVSIIRFIAGERWFGV